MKRLPVVYANDRSGHEYWRSLGEREKTPAFREALEREFPVGASESDSRMTRRGALSLMGAALALAGLAGCRRPEGKIVPYARPPEEIVPGRPLYFATSLALYGTALGVLVESHEGRPTKVEGNPRHPESLGATTAHLQATILDLYDPDRSQAPRERGAARTWEEASAALKGLGREAARDGGRSLAVIVEDHRSPTLASALGALRKALPKARVVRYEPFDRLESKEGTKIAFGVPLAPVYDLTRARVILALDADPLGSETSPIKNAKGWAAGRCAADDVANRLYAIESSFSITGASADHRFRCESGLIPGVLCALAEELSRAHGAAFTPELMAQVAAGAKHGPTDPVWQHRVRAIAKDIAANRGRSLILPGMRQPREVHALAHLINEALGNVGVTVRFVGPFDALDGTRAASGGDGVGAVVGDDGARSAVGGDRGAAGLGGDRVGAAFANDGVGGVEGDGEGASALSDIVREVETGAIRSLVLLGTNPVFEGPGDLGFARALEKAPLSFHLSSHVDETSALATWHLNQAHPFESWSDAVSEDGTASVVQPLIAPLWGGRTAAEVVQLLLGTERSAHELVRDTWKERLGATDFEKHWRRVLHDGVLLESAYASLSVKGDGLATAQALARRPIPKGAHELVFVPDSHAYDGRFANNGWLQELPDPLTKQTWGNAAWISASLAKDLGVNDGDLLNLTSPSGSIRIPALVAPGQADRTITVAAGQGRRFDGRVASGVGVDVYPIRRREARFIEHEVKVQKAEGHVELARTQEHFVMEGRPLAREGTVAEWRKNPSFAKERAEHPKLLSLWKDPVSYEQGHKWGMSIDLSRCIGCNACVAACQAENNIPIVGEENVLRSREMAWLRVDRYFEGPVEDPTSIVQPVTCQQCENAPCESVCPVGATVHSPEGLNDMVYNRCVGTRYCANNCPYKVRRFNFFEYSKGLPETRKMQFNPDVTVRSRGVMEKCTFCVQRINHAKIEAKESGREGVADGAAVTACQQSCPTQAIVFGDLNDRSSRAAAQAADPRSYHMLEELNVRPRVSYLAKIRNPNPELDS